MSDFKPFYFDGNFYFGWINNNDDLQKLYDAYKGIFSVDEILDRSFNNPSVANSFGRRYEHNGDITLRMFLRDYKIKKLIEE